MSTYDGSTTTVSHSVTSKSTLPNSDSSNQSSAFLLFTLVRNRNRINAKLSLYIIMLLQLRKRAELSLAVKEFYSEGDVFIPRAFALTILGAAEGAGLFASRKGSMLFEFDHTGYPFSLACTGEAAS